MWSTIVFSIACAAMFYSGYCRLVRVDLQAKASVRVAFWALTVAAAWCLAAVLAWGYQPGWPSAGMAAAMALVLGATSELWRQGVPEGYLRQPLQQQRGGRS